MISVAVPLWAELNCKCCFLLLPPASSSVLWILVLIAHDFGTILIPPPLNLEFDSWWVVQLFFKVTTRPVAVMRPRVIMGIYFAHFAATLQQLLIGNSTLVGLRLFHRSHTNIRRNRLILWPALDLPPAWHHCWSYRPFASFGCTFVWSTSVHFVLEWNQIVWLRLHFLLRNVLHAFKSTTFRLSPTFLMPNSLSSLSYCLVVHLNDFALGIFHNGVMSLRFCSLILRRWLCCNHAQ